MFAFLKSLLKSENPVMIKGGVGNNNVGQNQFGDNNVVFTDEANPVYPLGGEGHILIHNDTGDCDGTTSKVEVYDSQCNKWVTISIPDEITSHGTPVVTYPTADTANILLPYNQEGGTIENINIPITFPTPVSSFDSIDLKFDGNGDLIVEGVYTNDQGVQSTVTDQTPVELPKNEDYVEYTGNTTVPTAAPPLGVDTRVLSNGDRYDWDGAAWQLVPVIDTFGTVLQATTALTTTNEVDIAVADWYIEFPDGTTWSRPICPDEMTRAELIAIRNAGNLEPQCHYIITDPGVNGNLQAQKILIHAVDANTLSGCYIKTAHDNTAWVASYDIDTDRVEKVFDHKYFNEVTGNAGIVSFPFNNANVTNNRVFDSVLTYTAGVVRGNELMSDALVSVVAGNFLDNTVTSDATVTSEGNTRRNHFEAQSNTIINSGDFLENRVEGDASVTSSTTGDVDNNVFSSLSVTTINSGNFDTNHVASSATVNTSGVAVTRNHFEALSNTTINSGDFRNNRVQNDATVISSVTGDVDGNTFGNLSNSTLAGLNFDNSVIDSDANINMTGGTVINCKFEQASNFVMTGGVLRESTVGQDADVTISSQDNYENVFGNSVVFRQVGTGYVRYCTFEGTTTWTNGNNILSNVQSYTATINTTGSNGTIANSQFNRAYGINLQNIPSLTITDSTISDYATLQTNGAARIYIYRSTITSGGRVLCSAGGRIDMSYTNISSYGYVQTTGTSILYCNYSDVSSYGYVRNITGNVNRVERCNVNAQSNIRFDGTANNCRVYYSTATGGGSIYHTGSSNNSYIYYCTANSLSQIYTQNSTNARLYYNNASARSYVRSLNCSATHYIYYCNADASGYVQMNNAGGRMYSVNASSQSIAEKRGAGGNIYYSSFSSYFYAYITRTTGTNSGFFGTGRRTQTVTNPVGVAPFALGSAWLNFQ